MQRHRHSEFTRRAIDRDCVGIVEKAPEFELSGDARTIPIRSTELLHRVRELGIRRESGYKPIRILVDGNPDRLERHPDVGRHE